MIKFEITFEDHDVLFVRDASKFQLSVHDVLTNIRRTIDLTDQEAGAVMALMASDEFADELSEKLYEIAEPVMERLAKSHNKFPENVLRIIP